MRDRIFQKGIGLLELMLSLIVISVLMGAVLTYYRTSSTSQKVNQAIHLISGLMVASEDWLETYHSFIPHSRSRDKDLSMSLKRLVDLGKLPKDFCHDANCSKGAVNPWGGGLYLSPKDERHVEIKLTHIPASASGQGVCQQIADLLNKKASSDCSKSSEGEYSAVYPPLD